MALFHPLIVSPFSFIGPHPHKVRAHLGRCVPRRRGPRGAQVCRRLAAGGGHAVGRDVTHGAPNAGGIVEPGV